MKQKIGELFLQIIPVMIGVYLGFVVTNWAENRHDAAEAKVLVESLIDEMKTNKQQLERVAPYHQMLYDTSVYFSNSKNKLEPPQFFRGIRMFKLSNSAYQTGIQTGIINRLSLTKIKAINQLYTAQDDYNTYGDLMLSNLLGRDYDTTEASIRAIARFLLPTMSDVVIKEKELVEGYERVIEGLRD